MRKPRLLYLEQLEDRCTPATFSNPWPNPENLTLSFVPDATAIGDYQSELFRVLKAQVSTNSATWQREILRAFQTWAVHANINVSVVPDGGQVVGAPGVVQGDKRFGDVRVGAYPVVSSELAFVEPFDAAAGTWAGDLLLSSAVSFDPKTNGGYDLYTVVLHEAGHVFGLGHTVTQQSPLHATYLGPRMGLTAEDIGRLQAIYGARPPDAFEGSQGNDSFAKASNLLILDGLNLTQHTADLTTVSDQDYYKITLGASIGPSTVHLQTSGLSSLTARLSVYDSAQRLVDTVFAADPLAGDLALRLTPGLLGGTYYLRVQSAANDVFGVGSYKLTVRPDWALSLASLAEAAAAVLTNVENHTNDTLGSATGLVQLITQTDKRFDYVYKASISNAQDVDNYLLRSPTPPAGKTNVLTVMAWGTQAGGLDPHVAVLDALGKPVQAQVLSHESGTYVLQVPNAQANALYYVSVRPQEGASNPKGNYFLGADFTTVTTTLAKLVDNTPATPGAAPAQPNLRLTATRELLFHFVLSADKAGAAAGSAVRLTVSDPQGRTVATLIADAGTSQSVTLFLSKGTYTFRFESINRSGGAVVPLVYKLGGLVLNDPAKPFQEDPTESPSSPPPPSDSTTSNSNPSSSSSSSGSSPDGSYGTSIW